MPDARYTIQTEPIFLPAFEGVRVRNISGSTLYWRVEEDDTNVGSIDAGGEAQFAASKWLVSADRTVAWVTYDASVDTDSESDPPDDQDFLERGAAETVTGEWTFNPDTGKLKLANDVEIAFGTGAVDGARVNLTATGQGAHFDNSLTLDKRVVGGGAELIMKGDNGWWVGPAIDIANTPTERDLMISKGLGDADDPDGVEDFICFAHRGTDHPNMGIGVTDSTTTALARLTIASALTGTASVEPSVGTLIARVGTDQTGVGIALRRALGATEVFAVMPDGTMHLRTTANVQKHKFDGPTGRHDVYSANTADTLYAHALNTTDANPTFSILGSGRLQWGAGGATALDVLLDRNAANQLRLGTGDSFHLGDATGTGSFIQFWEQTSQPSAPASNSVRVFAEDNGSGKTRIVARFPTGAAVTIATEP